MNLFQWDGVNWEVYLDYYRLKRANARCLNCRCKLKKSKVPYGLGEYKYTCPRCHKTIILDKLLEEKTSDFLDILDAEDYKDAEIINLDGDLIRVQRKEAKDIDYWADVKISKNKKNELQLMVLAGSKKDKHKTQLFLDPKHERLGFDQNNEHPSQIFSKVEATFKKSKSEINEK